MKFNKTIAMMLVLACFSYKTTATERQIRVAVIDTGISYKNTSVLCKGGHKNFTEADGGIIDRHGHGTNISGLIHERARGVNYCQIVLKFFDTDETSGDTIANMANAIRHAVDLNVDIINISAGGIGFDQRESDAVKLALERGIKVVAAAGNESKNIDFSPYFPASYDRRIYVIGSVGHTLIRGVHVLSTSNYGIRVTCFERGRKMRGVFGEAMTGTSQAAAVFTGKLIRFTAIGDDHPELATRLVTHKDKKYKLCGGR
jgi:serine protease